MKRITTIAIALLFSVLLFSQNNEHLAKPKNIILMIGDGMGLAHVYSAITIKKDKLNIERCHYVGLMKTYSADDYVTDSAAGATAFSTGTKTNNGILGMNAYEERKETILETAENHNLSTGLVAACSVTHATPAAFISHVKSRDDNELIALDYLKTDVDVFIGGGKKYFNSRKDKLNLIDSLKKRNYLVINSLDEAKGKSYTKIAGLLYDEHPPAFTKGRGNMLGESAKIAIELLQKNQNGFFLMIEGSQIDWFAHKNNIDGIVSETLDFDNVVGQVLDFAEKDKHTLVIILADHETGGLTLPKGNLKEGTVKAKFSTINHTGVMVPVYSFGPGAENFTGIYENTDIYKKIYELFGF